MWPYVELHPHTWSKRLSVAEFAANNAINVSTGYTPFYLNAGEDPALPKNLLAPPRSTSNQAVWEAIGRMKEALNDAKLILVNVGILAPVSELPWALAWHGAALVPMSQIWRGPIAVAWGGLRVGYQ